MAALAEAFVRIRPDTSSFRKDAEQEISKAGPGLAKQGSRLGDRVGDSFNRGVSGRLTLLSRVGSRSLGLLATGAKAAGLGLAAAGVSGAAFGLKTAASMEQARISFTTMLGGAKQADAFLRQLQQFAAKTPFEFPELQTAASSLISVGINAKDVIPIMTTLGDVTAGMGTGSEGIQRATVALQQMSAAGKITGEDLNQLRDAGIPVFDLLAAATGKTKAQVAALAQSGKLGKKELDQLFAALKSGKGLERFNGLMQKQSKSLTGIFSTLKDNVSMTLANLVTPAIPAIEAGLTGISNLVQLAAPHVQAAFQSLSTGFSALVAAFQEGDVTSDGFVGVMERIGVAARQVFEYFKANVLPRLIQFGTFIKDTVIPALIDFGGWLVKNRSWLIPLGVGIYAIIKAIQLWAAITRAFAVVQAILNVVLAANPIGIVVLAIVGLVAALVVAYKTSDTFRNIVQKAWAGIQLAVSIAWNGVIKPVFSALSGFIRTVLAPTVSWLWRNVVVPAFNGISGIIRVVWPIIRGILQTWWAFIRNVLAPIITWLWRNVVAPVFNGIKATISSVWEKGIKPVLKAVGDFIATTVAPAFSKGVSAIGRAWDKLKSLATAPVNFVIGTVLNRGIFAAYNWVVSKFGGTKIPNLPLIGEGGGGGGGGRPLKLRDGMKLPGYGGGDRIPILAEAGEAVVPKHLVPEIAGWAKSRGIPGFQDGGVIGRGAAAGIGTAIGAFSGTRDPIRVVQDKITGALRAIGGSEFAHTIGGIARAVGRTILAKVKAMFTGGGAFPGVGAAGPANVSGNARLGQMLAAQLYGWTGGQWGALFNLWQGESGWNNNAQNPTSTAYGIPQFLNSTWASVGIGKTSDPRLQILAGLRYIAGRYGSPAAAYGAWLSRSPHWYASGLAPTVFSKPTLIGVGERGPETVSVTPGTSGFTGPFEVTGRLRLEGDGTATLVAAKLVQVGNRGRR